MSARRQLAKGFTLVEILIVVVILGILAAIVIPQFTSASESAKASSLVSQLQTIRSQLELYQVQHNGNYPDLSDTDDPWGPMTGTSAANYTSAGEDTTGDDYGPYLQKAPVNPFTDSSSVSQGDGTIGTASDTTGWVYDQTTGEIKAVLPSTVTPSDLGFDNDSDYAQAS